MRDVLLASLAPFALGAAHAAIFGVFLVAALGHFAGCRPGMRKKCMKSAANAALAVLACLVIVPGPQAAGLAALTVSATGWLKERITRNAICNCYGVLTVVLHPWRNGIRAVSFASGAGLLVMANNPADASFLAGATVALALLLTGSALAIVRSPLGRTVMQSSIKRVNSLAPGTISRDSFVGTDARGNPVTIDDALRPGLPLAFLLTSPSCGACQQVKVQIEPLLPHIPFPCFLLVEAAPGGASPAGLFDPQGGLRKTLGVQSLPSLVVIDGDGANLAFPIAMGGEAIFARFLQMLITSRPEPAALPPPLEARLA
jgi:hypothetical protein